MTSEERQCRNCKQSFTIEPEDFAMYEKSGIPPSDMCPRCRWKHLLAFWTFGRFRIAKSALSGKNIITIYPESVPFPLYEHKEWVSDAWDPLAYGRGYDASRSFFDQFDALQKEVPHPHASGTNNFKCEWSDDAWSCKDCYLSRSMEGCEELSYGYRNLRSKNSLDLTFCFDVEQSYDCFYCFKCYQVRHSFNSRDCIGSAFLADCRNCQNCFMCWNLRNKQYHIMNQPYSRGEYERKMKEFNLDSRAGVDKLKREFGRILREEVLHRENFNVNTANSDGNFLDRTKNCIDVFFVQDSENVRHSFRGWKYKDVIDTVGSIGERTALSVMDGYSYDTIMTSHCGNVRFSAYCDFCENCEYCFGCSGLREKKFCILNKQYSEADYKKLTVQIKEDMQKRGEWGRPFPLAMAYSGYNLSLAHLFYPETKERIAAMGGKWDEVPAPDYKDAIQSDELPDRIEDVKDDIVKQRIICPETKLSYNIAPHELQFYRQHGIPLPRRHFDWRTLDRFRPMTRMIEPQKGKCAVCGKEITHYYAPDLGYRKIACVECYQREVA